MHTGIAAAATTTNTITDCSVFDQPVFHNSINYSKKPRAGHKCDISAKLFGACNTYNRSDVGVWVGKCRHVVRYVRRMWSLSSDLQPP